MRLCNDTNPAQKWIMPLTLFSSPNAPQGTLQLSVPIWQIEWCLSFPPDGPVPASESYPMYLIRCDSDDSQQWLLPGGEGAFVDSPRPMTLRGDGAHPEPISDVALRPEIIPSVVLLTHLFALIRWFV